MAYGKFRRPIFDKKLIFTSLNPKFTGDLIATYSFPALVAATRASGIKPGLLS
jgi:hypothetical protein